MNQENYEMHKEETVNDLIKEQEDKIQSFDSWLEEFFIQLREVGGVPIIKDNCEDMFDNWLSNKDVEGIIELANLYGKQMYLRGNEIINKL